MKLETNLTVLNFDMIKNYSLSKKDKQILIDNCGIKFPSDSSNEKFSSGSNKVKEDKQLLNDKCGVKFSPDSSNKNFFSGSSKLKADSGLSNEMSLKNRVNIRAIKYIYKMFNVVLKTLYALQIHILSIKIQSVAVYDIYLNVI